MANEVEKFDPSKLMDGVKDRIRATFVSLIPDNAWEQMVKTEIDKFFQQTDALNSYHSRDPKLSHFSKVVFAVVEDETKKKVSDLLIQLMPGSTSMITQILTDELTKKAPEIFVSVIQGMIGGALYDMQQKLTNTRY